MPADEAPKEPIGPTLVTMNQTPEPPNGNPSWLRAVIILVAVAALYYTFFAASMRPAAPSYEIAYSEFKALAGRGEVSEVLLRGEVISGTLATPASIGPQQQMARHFHTRLPVVGDDSLIPALEANKATLRVGEEPGRGVLATLFLSLLPWLLLFGFFYFILQRANRTIGDLAIDAASSTALTALEPTTFTAGKANPWSFAICSSFCASSPVAHTGLHHIEYLGHCLSSWIMEQSARQSIRGVDSRRLFPGQNPSKFWFYADSANTSRRLLGDRR